MYSVKKLISLAFLLAIITPGFTQTLEELEDKIANTWRDSLAKNIPFFYLTDEYIKVENAWDRKIFTLDNKDIEAYLSLKGKLKPPGGVINGEVFQNIARKALKGSEFHMSLYGKRASNSDIKPALVEFGNVVCQCLEQKANTIDKVKLKYNEQEVLRNKYLMDCTQENMVNHRSKLLLEYNIQDQSSMQRFSNIMSGYFFTNCTILLIDRAEPKASIWMSDIRSQIRRNYGKAVSNVMKAVEEKITDTLSKQFVSIQNFKKAEPALLKAESLFRANPDAISMTKTQTNLSAGNTGKQTFTIIRNAKRIKC